MRNSDTRDSYLSLDIENMVDRAAAGDAEAFGGLYDIFVERI